MIDPPDGFYVIGEKYSVTLNPPDNHQYFGKKDRFHLFYNFVNEQMLMLGGRYVFFIELSEPNGFHTALSFKGPRLHLHGIVWFEDGASLRTFLNTGMYSLTRWTALDFDIIDDMSVWKKYIQKQKIVPKRYRTVRNVYTDITPLP